jgi:hypothetical protein
MFSRGKGPDERTALADRFGDDTETTPRGHQVSPAALRRNQPDEPFRLEFGLVPLAHRI